MNTIRNIWSPIPNIANTIYMNPNIKNLPNISQRIGEHGYDVVSLSFISPITSQLQSNSNHQIINYPTDRIVIHRNIVNRINVENVILMRIRNGKTINIPPTPTNRNLNKYTSTRLNKRAHDFPKNPSSGLFSNSFLLASIPSITLMNPDITLVPFQVFRTTPVLGSHDYSVQKSFMLQRAIIPNGPLSR